MLPTQCGPTGLVLTLGTTFHLERMDRDYLGAVQALRDLLKCPRVTGHVQGLSTGEALGELADPADWGDSSCSKQCCAESFALLLSLLHPPLSSSSLQHLYSEGKCHSTVSLI